MESVRFLWTDYEKLANDYRDYSARGNGNGHPNTVLKSAEEFDRLLRMSKAEAQKKIFGVGGNGYIPLPQQVERFRWRLCVSFYQYEKAYMPAEVVEFIESLCQMDSEDAMYYAKRYENRQWDLYSQPAQSNNAKKGSGIQKQQVQRVGKGLFAIAWILLGLYVYFFVKTLMTGMGRPLYAPEQYLMYGYLITAFLMIAHDLYSEEIGSVLFLVIASAVYGFVFCAAIYNPGGPFERVFWDRCLPIILHFIAAIIIGKVIGKILQKSLWRGK